MTHRNQFQKSEFCKGYNDAIDSPMMTYAMDMAMLELQNSYQLPGDMATAAANEFRRQGAVQYLKILRSLNTNPEPVKREPIGNLDHRH